MRKKDQTDFPGFFPKWLKGSAKIPDPQRINEIQKLILEVWPENSMPPCPLRRKDCKKCPKYIEGTKKDFDPCIRDVAHLAATYEARQEIAQRIVENRIKASERLRSSRYRAKQLKDRELEQNEWPKKLKSYGKRLSETQAFDDLKAKLIDGKTKAGNRELAKFIFSMDRLFEKQKKNSEPLIIAAMEVVEPPRITDEETIRKTRTRYSYLKKHACGNKIDTRKLS